MVLSTDQQETMFEEPEAFGPSYEEETAYEAADNHAEENSHHPGEPATPAEPVQNAKGTEADHWQPASAPPTGEASQPLPVLTMDDFAALEERVLRAVSLVRREREARTAAEARAELLHQQLSRVQAEASVAEHLQQEIEALRTEREQVRHRVERLLSQLDALEI